MASIGDDIRLLSLLSIRPMSSSELIERWDGRLEALDDSLRYLRERQLVVCTNGVWWRKFAPE